MKRVFLQKRRRRAILDRLEWNCEQNRTKRIARLWFPRRNNHCSAKTNSGFELAGSWENELTASPGDIANSSLIGVTDVSPGYRQLSKVFKRLSRLPCKIRSKSNLGRDGYIQRKRHSDGNNTERLISLK